MNKKELRKAINQLGRARKSPVLDKLDKKQIESIRQKLYTRLENNNKKDVKKMFLVDIIEKDSNGATINVFYDTLIGEYETLEKARLAAQEDFDHLTPQKQTTSVDYVIYKKSSDETNLYGNEIETVSFKIK